MKKKILVVYYSQSGQLREIVDHVTEPLLRAGHQIDLVSIRMKNEFPFPWNGTQFFDAMPESVLGIPAEIEPFQFSEDKYDLIFFAWQPWFLSPSIPASSALQDRALMNLMANTPVITLIGSRNMWINAQERVKKFLKQCNAKLVGNIVFSDRHMNMISAVTIQYWMFTGKKDRFLGIFPRPGVSDEDIAASGNFGNIILNHLEKGNWDGLQDELVSQKAVEPHTTLMFIESRAPKIFLLWAQLIQRKKNRTLWLKVFKYYLLFALFIIAPIILLIYLLLVFPFTGNQIRKRKVYFSGVN